MKLSQYATLCRPIIENNLASLESSLTVTGENGVNYRFRDQYLKDVVFQIVNDWKDSEHKDITFDRAFQIMGVI